MSSVGSRPLVASPPQKTKSGQHHRGTSLSGPTSIGSKAHRKPGSYCSSTVLLTSECLTSHELSKGFVGITNKSNIAALMAVDHTYLQKLVEEWTDKIEQTSEEIHAHIRCGASGTVPLRMPPRRLLTMSYRIGPWRAVFQQWLQSFHEEQCTGAISHAALGQMFITGATRSTIESSAFAREIYSDDRKRGVFKAHSVQASFAASSNFSHTPHLIATSTALFLMCQHLSPIFEGCQGAVHLAMEDLMKLIFVDDEAIPLWERFIPDADPGHHHHQHNHQQRSFSPSNNDGRSHSPQTQAKRSASPSSMLLGTEWQEEAHHFVRATYANDLQMLLPLMAAYREAASQRQKILFAHEARIERTISKLHQTVLRGNIRQWYYFTKRCIHLRKSIADKFMACEDFEPALHKILNRWKSFASWKRKKVGVVAVRRALDNYFDKEDFSLMKKVNRLRFTMEQLKASCCTQLVVLENLKESCITLRFRIEDLESKLDETTQLKKDIGIIYTSSLCLLYPETPDIIRKERSELLQEQSPLPEHVLHEKIITAWVSKLLSWDPVQLGKLLEDYCFITQSRLNLGIIGRTAHLHTLLRLLIVLLSPPRLLPEDHSEYFGGTSVALRLRSPKHSPRISNMELSFAHNMLTKPGTAITFDLEAEGEASPKHRGLGVSSLVASSSSRHLTGGPAFGRRSISAAVSMVTAKAVERSTEKLGTFSQRYNTQRQGRVEIIADDGGVDVTKRNDILMERSARSFRAIELSAHEVLSADPSFTARRSKRMSVAASGTDALDKGPIPSNFKEARTEERRREVDEYLRDGMLQCADANIFAHFVILFLNRLLSKGVVDQQPSLTSASPLVVGGGRQGGGALAASSSSVRRSSSWAFSPGSTKGVRRQSVTIAKSLLTSYANGSGDSMKRIVPNVFGKYLTSHASQDVWVHFLLSTIYLTQVGPSAGAFRSALQAFKSQNPDVARADTMSKVFLWESKASECREDEDPTFFVESPEEMRELWVTLRAERKTLGSDTASTESVEIYNAAVRGIVERSFYDTEAMEKAQRVYADYCAASPDIAHATVITFNYMASKMRAVFGAESSFWKPVLAVRVFRCVQDIDELVSTLSPIASMSEIDLYDKMLQALDDTDFFYAAMQSPPVEDVFSESLPEISVFYSLYCTQVEGATQPLVTMETWLQLNTSLFDINYSASIAESIFLTCVCRSRNMSLQHEVQSVTTFRTKMLVRGMETDAFLAKQGMDADTFCDALAVVASVKFPSPFTPLEQKIWPFIHSYLNPLLGVKSKEVKKKTAAPVDIKTLRATNLQDLLGGSKVKENGPRHRLSE